MECEVSHDLRGGADRASAEAAVGFLMLLTTDRSTKRHVSEPFPRQQFREISHNHRYDLYGVQSQMFTGTARRRALRCCPTGCGAPHSLSRASTPPTREMKFGKTLEDEMRATGVFGEALPWIDYGCVPAATSSRQRLTLSSFLFKPSIFPDHLPSPDLPAPTLARALVDA